jgi:hypothetical protein
LDWVYWKLEPKPFFEASKLTSKECFIHATLLRIFVHS